MSNDNYLSGADFFERNYFQFKQLFSFKAVVFSLLALILGNLLYLDFLYLNNASINQKIIASVPSPTPVINTMPTDNNAVCPQECLSQMRAATSSAKNSPATEKQNTINNVNNAASATTKEYFVPFGTGSSKANEWQDVGGLQATINTANYPQIKSVVFEASLHIPTGNQTAYVRLFNVTDKHPVWFSEISASGGTAQFITSPQVSLDSGNKTYQVQMKTSLQYEAILDQARLHIITY